MDSRTTFNILMYSHDTYGLGHIRRSMAIASQLVGPNINILILTGSPIAGRFPFPPQIDFIRIPGMIKETNDQYRPLSIKISPTHALRIRKKIILAAAKAFHPDLFIVDKEPLGLKREVLPTLLWFRKMRPNTRTVLGLRDIMDDAETVKKDWRKKGVYGVLDRLYTEVWVYGHKEFYDPIEEYEIPAAISHKLNFTGYIPRKTYRKATVDTYRRELWVGPDEKLVVATTGGGGDGYAVLDTYCAMLEKALLPLPIKSVLVTGPFMPEEGKKEIVERAQRLGVRVYEFYRNMEKLLAAADLVVCMGGYNTLCEVLSQKTLCLIVPRETPRLEQRLRAEAFHRHHLADYLPWETLSPEAMVAKIHDMLKNPEPIQTAVNRFSLTGIDFMRNRLAYFRGTSP
jgi:predicted glycosyltransferase